MTGNGAEAFELGAGFAVGDLQVIFYALTGGFILFWASYVLLGSYKQYSSGQLEMKDFFIVSIQTLALMSLLLLLLYIL